jgi:hypothetical protein
VLLAISNIGAVCDTTLVSVFACAAADAGGTPAIPGLGALPARRSLFDQNSRGLLGSLLSVFTVSGHDFMAPLHAAQRNPIISVHSGDADLPLPPKKTDAIEVRVSPEEKAALKRKASETGLTVSALIRQRLDDVLHENAPSGRAKRRDVFMSILKRTRSSLLSRPGLAVAAMLTAVALIASPGNADTLRMDLLAQIATSGDNARSVVSAQSTVDLDFDETFEIEVRDPAPGVGLYRFRVSAHAIDAVQAMLTAQILRVEHDVETVIAEPRLSIAYGEPANVQLGAPNAPEISMRVRVARGT